VRGSPFMQHTQEPQSCVAAQASGLPQVKMKNPAPWNSVALLEKRAHPASDRRLLSLMPAVRVRTMGKVSGIDESALAECRGKFCGADGEFARGMSTAHGNIALSARRKRRRRLER